MRDYLFRLTGRVTPAFAIESDGARFVLSTADKEISRILFIYGFYDRPLLQQVFDVMSAANGRAFDLGDKLFLDIGANIGSACVEACVHFGAAGAVAFEPDPDNFQFLRHNLVANDLTERVQAHRLALSDSDGLVDFELSKTNWGDHRVRTGEGMEDALGERDRQVTRVEARTLDSLVEAGTVDLASIGLAWIDVQAHEPNVLEGACALTTTDIPVVIEYWPYGLRWAGSLERLDAAIAASYTHFVDTKGSLNDPLGAIQPVDRLGTLRELYQGPGQPTDLILLKR